MLLAPEIIDFLAQPVVIILATRGPGFTPEIGRGVGVFAVDGQPMIDVAISRWQWPATVANICDNGWLAMTVSAPETYRTYQFKGRADLRPCDTACARAAEDYVDRALSMFATFQMPPAFAGNWLTLRDLAIARLSIDEIYVQTPGPQAGARAAGAV